MTLSAPNQWRTETVAGHDITRLTQLNSYYFITLTAIAVSLHEQLAPSLL